MATVADELVLQVKADTSQAIAGLKGVASQAKTSMDRVGAAATRAGTALTVGLTLPILGAGAAVLNLAKDAEQGFTKLKVNAGIPADVVEGFEKDLIRLAGFMGQDLVEAQDAMFSVWSSGQHDVTKAMEDVEAILMGVNLNLGTGADLALLAGAAYKNFGEDAETTMDTLNAAAGMAIVGPEQLGPALNKAASAAGLAGASYEDMAATVSFLTNTFADANKAGTESMNLFTNFSVISPQAQKALDEIGSSGEDLRASLGEQGLEKTLRDLQTQFKDAGMTDEEWVHALFPEKGTFLAAMAILDQGMGEYTAAIEEGAGGTKEGFAIVEETADMQLRRAVATIKGYGTEIGLTLLGMIEPYYDDIQRMFDDFAEWFDALGEEGKENLIKLAGGLAALGPALLGVGLGIKAVSGALSILGIVGAPIGAAISGIASALGGGAAGGGLAASAGAVALPILAIVAAIAAVIAIAYVFRDEIQAVFGDTFTWLSEWITERWSYIQGIIDAGAELIMGIFQDIKDFILPLWEDFTAFIEEVSGKFMEWWERNWPRIQKIIDWVFKRVATIIRITLIVIKAIWDAVWPAIALVIETTWETIKFIIRQALTIIGGVIEFFLAVLTGDWSGAWEAILGIFTGVWDNIKKYVIGVWNAIVAWFARVWAKFQERWGDAWDGLKEGVVNVFTSIAGTVERLFKGIINWLIDKLNWAIEKVNGAIGAYNKIPLAPDISKIPLIPNVGFGGQDLAGNFTVGDRGMPERVTLPAGSSVRPLPSMGSGDGDGITINLNAPQNDPLGIAREVGWELTKRGF